MYDDILIPNASGIEDHCGTRGGGRKKTFFFLHEEKLRHREVHELIPDHIIKLLITFELRANALTPHPASFLELLNWM